MPIDVEITTEGTRVLGGPVGSVDYCRFFTESVVQEVIEDLDVVSRMSSLQAQHYLRWVQFNIGQITFGA